MSLPNSPIRHWLGPFGSLVLALGVGWILPLFAQSPPRLFTEIMPQAAGDPPLGVSAIFPVAPNLADLPFAPPTLEVELPSGEFFTAALTRFERLAGFDPETGEPMPGADLEDLSYIWIGQGGGSEVIASVVAGVMTGIIHGDAGQLEISAEGGTAVRVLAPEELPSEEGDTASDMTVAPEVGVAAESLAWPPTGLARFSAYATSSLPIQPKVSALEDRVVLDLLVLYTDLARQQANGDPSDPSAAALVSLLNTGIYALNVAFDNSEVNAEVRLVGIEPFDEVQPSGVADLDLQKLRNSLSAQALRDLVNADLVSLVFPSLATPGVNLCGFSVVQRPGCGDFEAIPGCDMLNEFSAFSFNWVSKDCVLGGRFSLGHEILHNLGAEHNEETGVPRGRASFPFAFGYQVDSQNRTMMALSGPVASTRILHISNPDVLFNGFPTGSSFHNNSKVVNFTGIFVEGFRGVDDFIFGDVFERGDLRLWSESSI